MEIDAELQTLLAEQRRELTAALSTDSDLEFAFKLQMQEAMKVSLAVQSPSSSSEQQFDFPIDSVSSSGMAHLLAEEIDKFERERSDREEVEAEMRRIRNDLSRRIHDQAFARELDGVPEAQWRKNGDRFQKPYGEGSSATETNGEVFRLYCKGLVSEERVNNVMKMLAGIGVTICDSNDSVILELSKPLIGGGDTSGQMAEVKALIEGLNAAVTLGLKRITVFCADNIIYQFVTGKWIARQRKVATLVDQVTLLQRKFIRCSPALVARKDIIYVLKLARDAIVSQISRPVESRVGKNWIENCKICLEDTDVNQMFSVNSCDHRYCFSCMRQHVQVKMLQGILPTCPHEECKFELKIESCKNFLTPELFDIMSQRIKESSVPASQKIYCPFPRCSALMSKAEVYGYASAGGVEQAGAIKCTKCRGLFCVNCKVPWHSNMTCYDFKRLNPFPLPEEAKLKSLASRNLWRQCLKCNHMVELAEGCFHISCRCGNEFCYKCGAEWKNKKPTCSCPLWAEPNILYDDPNVRRQRRRMF